MKIFCFGGGGGGGGGGESDIFFCLPSVLRNKISVPMTLNLRDSSVL